MANVRETKQAVQSTLYSEDLCDGMGASGSNELYLQSKGKVIRPRLAYALDLADLRPNLKILDIGCGRGEVVLTCSQAGVSLAAGVDYAQAPIDMFVKNAKSLNTKINQDKVKVVLARCDAKALPFEDGSFDRVFMLDIVEHLYQWELEEVYKEVHRIMSPTGYLVVHTLPNRWAMDYGYKLARLILRRLPKTPPDKRDTIHVNEQSPPQLTNGLVKNGFKCHVWLHDLMIEQANWAMENRLGLEDQQTLVYGRFHQSQLGRLYGLMARLPTRMLLVTDLFAIAWASGPGPSVLRRLPKARSEGLISRFGG